MEQSKIIDTMETYQPPRGPHELWLQHADCDAPATGAEVEAVSPGKIFMTRGWGEVARFCQTGGALVIYF